MQDKESALRKILVEKGPSLLLYDVNLRKSVVNSFLKYINNTAENFLIISPLFDVFENILSKNKNKGAIIVVDDLLKLLVLVHTLTSLKHMFKKYLIIVSDIDIVYKSSIINYNLNKCISWLNELLSLFKIHFNRSIVFQPISNKEYSYKSLYMKILFRNVKNIVEIGEEGANILRSIYS